jgi:hypothetical protein
MVSLEESEIGMKQIEPVIFNAGAWSKHVPFAYELIRDLKPKIFVELGSHRGESYFSFCQSVKDHSLGTTCYAVDTWQGDEQAGHYGDEVYEKVNHINQTHFSNFSYLVRSTFESAAKNFSDSSVQLLHIDGFHTYEAVKHDFDTWFDKVAPDGVILFHDTMVRHEEFGVWKFWEEVKDKYVTFEFKHGYGLGVLFKDAAAFKGKSSLLDSLISKNADAAERLHKHYQNYYENLDRAYLLDLYKKESERLKVLCQQHEEHLSVLGRQYTELHGKISRVKSHFLYPLIRFFYRL